MNPSPSLWSFQFGWGEAWGTRGWGVAKGRWQEEAKLRRLSQAGHGMCK